MDVLNERAINTVIVLILVFGSPLLIFVWFKVTGRYRKKQEDNENSGKPASRDKLTENAIIREIGRFILVILLLGLLFVLLPILFVGFFFSPLWLGWLAEQSPLAFAGLLVLIFVVGYWIIRLRIIRNNQADNV